MKKIKILIVDDDANLALLIEARLRAAGYVVRTANSAVEAYRAFASFKPHLIITDIGIGDENGLDLMTRIRSKDVNIKTIYMTGDPGRYRAALAEEIKLHHAEVLPKPFEGSELVERVSAQTRRSRKAA